jgi:hypothetical protein
MPEKQGSPNLQFAVALLKKNPKVDFQSVKSAAEKRGLKMMPIIFGRAKLALGISKPGSAKRARRAGASAGSLRGHRNGNGFGGIVGIEQLVDAVRRVEALQRALDEIRSIVDSVEAPRRGPGRPRGRRAA